MSGRSNWVQEVTAYPIQEDDLLCQLASQMNGKQWSEVENKFNSKFPQREKTCKQLRQRYKNFLQYEKGRALIREWTQEEEKLLYRQYLQKGSKWT